MERIAVALAALTTARVSYRMTVRFKGRDVPAWGDGLIDFGGNAEAYRMTANGREAEHLDIGSDRFHKLPDSRQQATGKQWAWEKGCPYGNYWAQVTGAVGQIASCTGNGTDVLAGEQVHRYSLAIKPRRQSFAARLFGREKASPSTELYTHLHAHGTDHVDLDIWLTRDQKIRKMHEHQTALESALLDGRTTVVTSTREYTDFGVPAHLIAPPLDEVLGAPFSVNGELHT